MSNEGESISVAIRVRPLNDRELKNHDTSILNCISDRNIISITSTSHKPLPGPNNAFQYDHIFAPEITTKALYDTTARRIVRSTLDGYNGTIFAYGQTSSGK